MTRPGTEHPSIDRALPGVTGPLAAAVVRPALAPPAAAAGGLGLVPFGRQELLDPATISHCTNRIDRQHRSSTSFVGGTKLSQWVSVTSKLYREGGLEADKPINGNLGLGLHIQGC